MGEGRAVFSGKLGFVLTAAGAAVGLGCLWRFPFIAPQNGGILFVLLYIVLLLALGIPLLITEMAIGRYAKCGILEAFTKLHPKFAFLGGLCLIAFGLIQPYYSILGGELSKYTFMYFSGQSSALVQDGFFQSFISQTGEPILWLGLFVGVTAIISFFGLNRGVERICKILLPLEACLLVFLMIYCLTLPHALEGLAYFFTPNFETFGANTILAAMGQVFYSLSIGFGIMLTFGSFVEKKISLLSSAWTTAFFTLFIALIASALIIPAGFICTGGNPEILGSGTLFVSLPTVFNVMDFGWVVGAIFFLILTIATLTGNVTTLEVVVTALQDKFGMSRLWAVLIPTIFTFAAGVVISLGYGVLSWIHIGDLHLLEIVDRVLSDYLLPIVVLFICVLVGYYIRKDIIAGEIGFAEGSAYAKVYLFMIRYFCPICIILIFAANILTKVL